MHELKEASLLLRNTDGTVKNFNTFLRDVQKINTSYNENYLRAEYNFAVSSSQMASRWADHSPDAMLQYRTSNDESVRDTHKPLHNITLPIADPFWDNYYAPNGWGCRCTVVEVRKSKYEKTPTKDAMKLGEAALSSQGKKGLIFKFNPGKHGTIFPEKHPYYCRQMGSCDKVNLAAKFKDDELCRGCKLLSEITGNYKNITTKNGNIEVHSKHGKNELKENIEIATYLAEKYGYDIILLPVFNNQKNADAYNKTLRIKQEFKRISTPTANAIDMALKYAKKQANNIVLDINVDIENDFLLRAVRDRVNRSKTIISVTIIKDNNDKTYTRDEILSFL